MNTLNATAITTSLSIVYIKTLGVVLMTAYASSSSLSSSPCLRSLSCDSWMNPCACPASYLAVFYLLLLPRPSPSLGGAVDVGGALGDKDEESGEGERRDRGLSAVVGVRIGKVRA